MNENGIELTTYADSPVDNQFAVSHNVLVGSISQKTG